MNPPLRMSATPPNMIAASAIAVRSFWRKTFLRASLNTVLLGALAVVPQGVDDIQTGSLPRRKEARQQSRTERQKDALHGQLAAQQNFTAVPLRHAGGRRHRNTHVRNESSGKHANAESDQTTDDAD